MLSEDLIFPSPPHLDLHLVDNVVRGPECVEHAEREVLQRVGGGLPVGADVRARARRRGRHLHGRRIEPLAARGRRERRVVAVADGADLVHPDLPLLRVGRAHLVWDIFRKIRI